MRYFIVDDDPVSRRMLKQMIEESGLGVVIGEAENGIESLSKVMSTQPDFVLIDLLMPEMDGIETMERLKKEGFRGQFVMISQVVNKDMVGEAYEKGVEFFIHKPLNKVEVTTVLKKMKEQTHLADSLMRIKESIAQIEVNSLQPKQQSVKEIVVSILNDIGIAGESGSNDIITMIELLMQKNVSQLPPLKELYEAVAKREKNSDEEIKKESKAIEQRIRRTILAAMNNLATLGSIDYTNPEFEYYAPRYFDFQEIRNLMNDHITTKTKVNIRKFLQVLYLEVRDKFYE